MGKTWNLKESIAFVTC